MLNEDLKLKILEYLCDDLSVDEKQIIEKIFEENDEVKKYYNNCLASMKLLDSVDSIEPASDYVYKFWNRVSESELKSFKNILSNPGLFIQRWVLVFSFFVIVVAGSLIFNYLSNDSGSKFAIDERDEEVMINLDRSLKVQTISYLDTFGPWDK